MYFYKVVIIPKKYRIPLSVLSGLLLGLSWIPSFTFLIFLALVPFFIVERSISTDESILSKNKFLFWYSYLTFFVWNLTATWWVAYASFGGAAMAIVCNALLMAFTYLIYLFSVKKINSIYRIFIFIPFWLSFEYLHTDWDLSWTWLTLGNVFAFKTSWIQWYEYSGVSGGSFWILIVNCILFILLSQLTKYSLKKKIIISAIFLFSLILPLLLSFLVKEIHHPLNTLHKRKINVNALIIQPSFNPYNEKFDIPFIEQFSELKKLINNKIDTSTDYLILPETYIPHQYLGDEIYENVIDQHPYIRLFFDSLVRQYPRLHVVTGADTHYQYADGEEHQPTARKYSDVDKYFDCYNSSIQIAKNKPLTVYHKSKLVPGVEMMPFPRVFGLLADLAIKMGGTSGSLGRQDQREVFDGPKGAKVGTAICYESIFGEHVAEYVQKGANVLFILTNDAWWDDTPGYRQHLAYACLRAIETRKYIARSANTGISCVINDMGEIIKSTGWYEKAVIKYSIPINNNTTFFVRNGDVLSKIFLFLSLAILLLTFILRFKK